MAEGSCRESMAEVFTRCHSCWMWVDKAAALGSDSCQADVQQAHLMTDVVALALVMCILRREILMCEHNVSFQLDVGGCRVLNKTHKVCNGQGHDHITCVSTCYSGTVLTG